ncbi:Flagellar hook-length control protein FliK [Minicystis rosea]|nr:Flagellar hook-length control protein FliK [Minicystis rosea]
MPGFSPESVQEAAQMGVGGAGAALPHLDAIQRSFGRHDISRVQAHLGVAASRGARAMGAEAFATGDHVAFARPPSLRVAAHEAAHIVQQRSGVSVHGGVGRAGDTYERHADAVADLVVQGRSAEVLLGEHGAPAAQRPGSAPVVQRILTIGSNFKTIHRPEDIADDLSARESDVIQEMIDAAENHNFPSKAAVRAAIGEAKALKDVDSAAVDMDLDLRPDAAKPAGFYKPMMSSKGFTVHRSDEHEYPDAPLDIVSGWGSSAKKVVDGRDREDMTDAHTKMMLGSKQTAPTAQHELMKGLQKKGQKLEMQANNVARAHKLADSSIYAIMYAMGVTCANSGALSSSHKGAIAVFADALGVDGDTAVDHVETIAAAMGTGDEREISRCVNAAVAEMSFNDPNLRFGYADVNTVILYGFDPNVDAGGDVTPKSKMIAKATLGLAKVKLIAVEIAKAATTQVESKKTGKLLTSSRPDTHPV